MSDDLLVKFLLGETMPDEYTRVRQWIAADSRNEKYFLQFKTIWDQSKELQTINNMNEDVAWQRFKLRIDQPVKQPAPVISVRSRFAWIRVAAILLTIAGAGWLGYSLLKPAEVPATVLNIQTQKNIHTDTLPDRSIVILNKNSKLSYPSRFTGRERNITLEGEAFFNIMPDKEKPFIIKVGDITVKVIGTSFNIKSGNGKTEVVVETGIVQVIRDNKMVELKPTEKLVVQQTDSTFASETSTDKLYNYYRSKEFVCDDTPLEKVVEVLNEAYEADIIIENKALRKLPLNTTFNNESLDTILSIISETFNITVEKRDSQIILK